MPAVGDHRQRVVLLQEQLPGRVEADRAPGRARQQFLGCARRSASIAVSQSVSTSRPSRGPAAVVSRSGEAFACQPNRSFGSEPAAVDPVVGPAADADDPAVLDGDVHRVAVGVQHRRRLHPALDLLGRQPVGEVLVDATGHGPGPYGVRAPHGSAIRSARSSRAGTHADALHA